MIELTDEQREKMIAWIDNASYYALLQKWRFSPPGDPYFTDPKVSDHYKRVMEEKRDADPAAAVRASKDMGW